ncbi:MAG: YfcE family phosphodiesterase [Clostridia bacterium]|nr:YfcE family phosphodiesterase [Clostridia bacterium]
MKCLCFSDSHGTDLYIKRALDKHPYAEVVFFLGDGLSDIEALTERDRGKRMWLFVRGNCDLQSWVNGIVAKKTDEINLLGKRIVFTHGDLYGVKYGTDGAVRLGVERRADVVLFGHTHQPFEKYASTDNGGVYLFNPGSIGARSAAYGVITIENENILFSHLAFL